MPPLIGRMGPVRSEKDFLDSLNFISDLVGLSATWPLPCFASKLFELKAKEVFITLKCLEAMRSESQGM